MRISPAGCPICVRERTAEDRHRQYAHWDADKLENYKNELQKAFPDLELIYFPLTMSIGTHVGPGGLGIGAVISH